MATERLRQTQPWLKCAGINEEADEAAGEGQHKGWVFDRAHDYAQPCGTAERSAKSTATHQSPSISVVSNFLTSVLDAGTGQLPSSGL